MNIKSSKTLVSEALDEIKTISSDEAFNMTNEENVVVAVRIRPPLEREINRKTGYNSCIG